MIRRWEHLSFDEIKQLDKSQVVFLPIGTIEAHGKHLPVASDSIIANDLTQRVCFRCRGILGPLISFGPCETLLRFPGTITISEHTSELLLKDIAASIIHHGFKKLCIINGHGGNIAPVKRVVKRLKHLHPNLKIMFISWYDMPSLVKLKQTSLTYKGDHADRAETEMMLLIAKKLVKLEQAVDDLPAWPKNFKELDDYSQIMEHAVDGFPSKSKLSTAKKLYESVIIDLAEKVADFFKT
jgi:creatinine amidohydrolase